MASMGDRDLDQVRGLLDSAQGYAVVGRDGKRAGIFIEVDGADGDRIAIRKDRVFLWRREFLPLSSVEDVVPERRLILLNGDRDAGEQEQRDDPADVDRDWRGRIESYVSGDAEARPETPARHLRFISTPSGYRLVETEGPPPSTGATVAMSGEIGPFFVMKLGPSPLPNDDRICAYLAPDSIREKEAGPDP
jgi:hypothetical protein